MAVARTGSRQLAALKLLRRRLIQAVPLILGVVVINFCLIQLAPGSFLELMTAENQVSDPATIELLRKTYGLEDPVWLQLLKYIWALMRFDFGFSYRQNIPVIQAIWVHLPATLLLMVSSITLALAVGVAAGVVASMKVRTFWDSLVSVAAMFFFAAPSFWLGIMLIVLFAVKLGWLPVGGMMTIGGGGRRRRHFRHPAPSDPADPGARPVLRRDLHPRHALLHAGSGAARLRAHRPRQGAVAATRSPSPMCCEMPCCL